ncbi:hypothetical protein [Halalkalibacter krulwichiae]|nr:hypothetical protein [Halalkalibacter krulwichiae]
MSETDFLIESSYELNVSIEYFMESALLLFNSQHELVQNENMFDSLRMLMENLIMLQNLQMRRHTFYRYSFESDVCMICTQPELLNIYFEAYEEIKNRLLDSDLCEEKQFMLLTLFDEIEYLLGEKYIPEGEGDQALETGTADQQVGELVEQLAEEAATEQQVEGIVEQLAEEEEEELVIEWIFDENNLEYVWLVKEFTHDDY